MNNAVRVLLVEDSEDDAELIALAMKRGGLRAEIERVETRETLEEALASNGWDVVIADFSMPRLSMREALAIVRRRKPELPFLIVSATILEDDAIQAMREGACDFIMKDRLARLAPAVERELREAANRREQRKLEERVRQDQRMESLGVLAGGVAHDFNNLLVGIMGNTSLALDILPDTHKVKPLLDDVMLASQKAADLTRQMLAYAGQSRFVSEPTDLSTVANDIGCLVRSTVSKKVIFDFQLARDLPPIDADRTQVQQLVMNLLINGAEAIGTESGAVRVSTDVRDVDISELMTHHVAPEISSGRFVVLEVSDDGCGMDEATQTRIFDPFFTTKFAGRGLGLAAALGIVRGHRGALKVSSEVGRGSTFEILFPAMTSPPLAARQSPPETARRRAAGLIGHILIVDDEELVRSMAKAALERHGYTVLLSENGHHAVEVFKGLAGQISLVLLDRTMPMMSGEDAFRRLRAIRPDLEIILTSGYEEPQALVDYRGHPVSGFLKKPYTTEELAAKVSSVLGRRAAIA
jgi:signal transduction histidine kinase